jgi:hypothetical protein
MRYVFLGTGESKVLNLFDTAEVLPKTTKQCCILLSHCLYVISLPLASHVGNRNCVHYTLKLLLSLQDKTRLVRLREFDREDPCIPGRTVLLCSLFLKMY